MPEKPDAPNLEFYPGHAEFVFDSPLYSAFQISDDDENELISTSSHTIDGYCIFCKTNRVFKSSAVDKVTYSRASQGRDRLFYEGIIDFACAKVQHHRISLYIRLSQGKVVKYGQNPSYADIVTAEDSVLTKVLDPQDRREYNKAVGLAAHDAGVGAYAYLRRIFERLIWARFNLHKDENKWIEDDFIKLRMNEKIAFLRIYLPPLLVSNGGTYSILSDGLHNLSEEECLAFFPILRKGILLILQQEVERKERERNEAEFSRAISEFSKTANAK